MGRLIEFLACAAMVLTLAWLSSPARAQPAFTAFTGPVCTGTYVYPLPHLSTETDAGGTRYTTVVIIANFSATTAATIQACAYNAGAFIGGTSFTLPSNNRLYTTDPQATSTTTSTRPVALASMFNLTQLPSSTAFPAVITSNIPLEIEYGYVSATTRVFTFGHPALAGTVMGLAHIGSMPGVYPGFIVVSNPNNVAVTYNLSFLSDDGTVAVQVGNLTLAAFQRQRFDLSNFTDANGNAVSLRSYYAARISSTAGGPIGAVSFIVTPTGDVVINTMTPVSP
ncbi:MAG: hypothetical protein JO122_05255 [Acetobacteraceae bacterium]|nr:hypothetical protein [Acetobacteraceae bacterium]